MRKLFFPVLVSIIVLHAAKAQSKLDESTGMNNQVLLTLEKPYIFIVNPGM
jgi:hypothetical protein